MSLAHVSILIAARNEEMNLPGLLRSISELSYDKDKLEVIFGNDASTDNTAEILEEFASQNSFTKVIHLEPKKESEQLKGKARVLEKLAKHATGQYYFFTDADISLPPDWIQGILKHFTSQVGVVVGLTTLNQNSIWSAFQGMEWLSALHIMHVLSKKKIASTGMGNNMAVSKEAYWAVGGYDKIGFSIVEDFALYKAILDADFAFKQAFTKDVLAYTKPPERFFEQRKRWLKGGFESGSSLILTAMIQIILFPLVLLLLFLKIQFALYLILYLLLFHFFQIWYIEKKLNLKGYLKYVPLFALYMPISWFLQFVVFLRPSKTIWKGRDY
ncbi:glycosyltransferase [uncultured Arcticibacterium sp.]|uniref:glycosyltransferase n=1 Tax=uncultured Arcticibacterium sp. TaxID=2173042 RepID=UPI0030F65CEC